MAKPQPSGRGTLKVPTLSRVVSRGDEFRCQTADHRLSVRPLGLFETILPFVAPALSLGNRL
jgi:hypothetical protein